MNSSAERHLVKAQSLLEKGDGFYRKAAEEIVAARNSDPTLTYPEIGKWFGKGKDWARRIVEWHTGSATSPTPYSGDGPYSRAMDDHRDRTAARKILREAPLEQVEQLIAELPAERKEAIRASAGHAYSQARREYREQEANLTPAQKKEREAGKASVGALTSRMLSGFSVMEIASHLEAATEHLAEMNKHHTPLPAEMAEQIDRALAAFQTEYDVARVMAGIEEVGS